jgi:preprotein translocase subunit SecY
MLMGGTGLLIVVGVSLDIMQKVGAFFLAHQYRGLGGIGEGDNAPKKSGKRF